ncbi:MAG: Cytochrome bd-type quinol oxidase subunit 2-like protein, partial [Solirubrobacterales bacterium]|nr:Cytochrome bd-type quinol oxidase subunit 2-like protein [Solirubrobacterales bacterium]
MTVADVPLLFVLAGLMLYVVLGGADYGAAIWQATAGRGTRAERIRAHAHDTMAPVWEANHVWLIFVLTVLWTAYPTAFASLASTLAVALTAALLGIVGRGAAYALRSGSSDPRELVAIDAASAAASVLAPFALGAAAGGIASRRVPVGNAAGDLWSSWLNPTSVAVGIIAVSASAYLAAVFLTADARRVGDEELVVAFRRRALGAGLVTGALALAGLVVLHQDAHRLFTRLLSGPGLPAVLLSVLAGGLTMLLTARGRHGPARYTAALAVAAVIAGWALAQQPELLPGLSVHEAAAPRSTQIAVIVAVLAGGAVLFPSLALLLRLTLAGELREQ